MPQALLLAGNSKRFLDAAQEAAETLRAFGCKMRRVVPVGYISAAEALDTVSRFLSRARRSAALIVYAGHGGEEGWSTSDTETLPYARLVPVLASSLVPTMVINDTCHAGSLIDLMKAVDGRALQRVAVIASVPAGELSYGGTIGQVLETWREREPFIPRAKVIEQIQLSLPPAPDIDDEGEALVGNPHFIEEHLGFREEPPIKLRWGADIDHHFFPRA